MELFAEKRILTISQLTSLVREVVEENFEQVWVQGEISNLSQPASGHAYFTLKDADAQLRCVMFRGNSRQLRFRLAEGLALIVRGRLTVYAQRGDYQLVVEYAEPQGLGALQQAFQQVKERLAREGLFAEERKRPLPLLPQRIGIVTSPTGAAIHDILHVLDRRFRNLELLIAPVRVQGEGAAAEIAAAIADCNRYGALDVLIVGRGGGSLEDLWAFNEELVARAIAASKIPVISAVGHEVDYTIADFVADLRAPTPSAAAELVVRSKTELAGEVAGLWQRLVQAGEQQALTTRHRLSLLLKGLRSPETTLGFLQQRLDDLSIRLAQAYRHHLASSRHAVQVASRRLAATDPERNLAHTRERLVALASRLQTAQQLSLASKRESVRRCTETLHALSPLQVLGRGYSLVQKLPEQQLVTSAAQLATGDELRLRFASGGARCSVIDVVAEER